MSIIITIEGHHHSKKSYLIVLIKRYLESLGVTVHTQDFHLKEKYNFTEEEILEKVKNLDVLILEQET
jgi:hypothetical protein